MTNYFSLPGVNFSTLKHLDESPAHAWYASHNGVEETAAMTFGSALHARLLEPEVYKATYREAPNARTNAGKEESDALRKAGKVLLKPEELENIAAIAEAVAEHTYASHLIATSQKELALQWQDTVTGLDCKAKIDMYHEPTGLLIDIKGLRDCSSYEVSKAVCERHYYAQLAFYERALRAHGKDVNGHALLVCAKSAPYTVHLFTMPADLIQHGHQKCSEWLTKWKELEQSGDWFQATELKTPNWFVAKMENSYGSGNNSTGITAEQLDGLF